MENLGAHLSEEERLAAESFVAPVTGAPEPVPNSRINAGELIGAGAEKKVYQATDNPDKVVGIFKEWRGESPQETKGRYYIGKILHLLMPDQFPDIHYATNDPHAIIMERVTSDQDKPYYAEEQDREALLESTKLKTGVELDPGKKNFLYRNGQAVSVDNQPPWTYFGKGEKRFLEKNFNEQLIAQSLMELPQEKQEQGMKYLERLMHLNMELASIYRIEEKTEEDIDQAA